MIATINGIKTNHDKTLQLLIAIVSVAFILTGLYTIFNSHPNNFTNQVQQQRYAMQYISRLAVVLIQAKEPLDINQISDTLRHQLQDLQGRQEQMQPVESQSLNAYQQIYFQHHQLHQSLQVFSSQVEALISTISAQDPSQLPSLTKYFYGDSIDQLSAKFGVALQEMESQGQQNWMVLVVQLVIWLLTVIAISLLWMIKGKAVMATVTDVVTQLQKENAKQVNLKEQAQELAEKKERCLQYTVQEIRSPVHGVLGLVNLLKQTKSTKQRSYYTNKIEKTTATLSQLTKQVHDFLQAESGTLVVEKKEFLVLQLIDDVVAMMKPLTKKKQLQIYVRVAMDFPENILGDENLLRKILANLLANAIQASHEGGQVTLFVSSEQETQQNLAMHISVVDTGSGLSEEQIQRVFDPFEVVAKGETYGLGGTGLGLTIVKQLINLMNGDISCQSQVEKGTTFKVTLPISVVSHSSGEQNQDVVDRLSRLRVLVVDDEPSILDIVSAVLGKVKVHVKTCELAEEAYSYVTHEYQQGREIDIIITDWEMPGMNGEQMATKITEFLDSFGVLSPKFILLSAFKAGDSSSYERTMFNSVIKKPFKVPELINNLLIVSQVDFEADSEDVVPLLPLSGKRVLLIEDQQVNQVIVSQMLSGYGMWVDLASSGIEGIRKLTDNDYDIIVTDIQLPQMDGIELTHSIRAIESWLDIPIIGLSTDDSLTLKHRCLNAGINAFVTKPVKAALLLDEIVPLLNIEAVNENNKLVVEPEAVFDVDSALQRFDGNHQLLAVMMKKFILQFGELEQQVHDLQQAGDLEELAYYTHNLKGTSETLALTHLSHCADTVTVSINKNKTDTLSHQLDYLGKIWRESKAHMEYYLAQ